MSKLVDNACLWRKKLNFHFLISLFSGIADHIRANGDYTGNSGWKMAALRVELPWFCTNRSELSNRLSNVTVLSNRKQPTETGWKSLVSSLHKIKSLPPPKKKGNGSSLGKHHCCFSWLGGTGPNNKCMFSKDAIFGKNVSNWSVFGVKVTSCCPQPPVSCCQSLLQARTTLDASFSVWGGCTVARITDLSEWQQLKCTKWNTA